MKIIYKLTALTFVAAVSTSGVIAADKIDWKACDKEVKEFKCTGNDKAVWSCLEKHDDKLSKTCQVAHEQGDKLFKK